jgi:hypothetical protein
MRTALVLAATAGMVAGCGSLPWVTRDPPAECGIPPDLEISWAGRGDPVAIGLVELPRGEPRDLGTGEIWVATPPAGVDNGSHPAFCYVDPNQGVLVGTLPQGWQPP